MYISILLDPGTLIPNPDDVAVAEMGAPRPLAAITLGGEACNGAVYGTLGVVLILTLGFAFMNEKKGKDIKFTGAMVVNC